MVVQITEKEYEIVSDWWKQRNFPSLPRNLLPDTSYLVYKEGKPIIFTSLYLPKDSGCNLAMTAWYTANPETSWDERFEGLENLETFIQQVCKENQTRSIISFTSKPNLSKNLNLVGYEPIEQGTFSIKYF